MYTKKEYEDHLTFAQMMKHLGTEVITAIVDGEPRQVDIDMYISKLEQIISQLDDEITYH